MVVGRRDFFEALFGEYLQSQGGFIETREIDRTTKKKRRLFHSSIETIANHHPEWDYYFGVCPRETKNSGTKNNIRYISSIWADIDYGEEGHKKKNKFATPADALSEIQKFEFKPSILVDSGHGLHVYWLLKELEEIENISYVESIIKGVVVHLGGDDSGKDISRILRIPDSFNLKVPDKPILCKVIGFDKTRLYSLSNFESFKVEVGTVIITPATLSDVIEEVDVDKLKLNLETKQLILKGRSEDDHFPSRSEADFKVICELVKKGFSNSIIQGIFAKYAIGEKYRQQGNKYLEHSIGKARGAVSQEKMVKARNKKVTQNEKEKLQAVKLAEKIKAERNIFYCAGTFYEYGNGLYCEISEEIVQMWIVEAVDGEITMNKTKEVVYFLKTLAYIDTSEVNKTPLINLKNGFFDLETFTLHQHNPRVLSTVQLPINYNPKALCNKWHGTLNEIFDDDQYKISTLQEYFGLCLTKETKYEKALVCIGEGANGKSVILNTLEKLLGRSNCSAIPLEKFDNRHYTANLFGKLANISIETNAKSEVYDSTFKAIVSGDLIEADAKYKKPFSFNPFSKLIFAVNTLPRVDDKTDAYFRRLIILWFNRTFAEREQNKNLRQELLLELDGIFLWALEGLKRLRERGYFEINESMLHEINEYRRENSNVLIFVEEECRLDKLAQIDKNILYTEYDKWCHNNGYKPLSKIKFGKELSKKLKLEKNTRTAESRVWVGLRLQHDFE